MVASLENGEASDPESLAGPVDEPADMTVILRLEQSPPVEDVIVKPGGNSDEIDIEPGQRRFDFIEVRPSLPCARVAKDRTSPLPQDGLRSVPVVQIEIG